MIIKIALKLIYPVIGNMNYEQLLIKMIIYCFLEIASNFRFFRFFVQFFVYYINQYYLSI